MHAKEGSCKPAIRELELTRSLQDKLIVPDSVTNIFNITETIGCIMTGNIGNSAHLASPQQLRFADL